MSNAAQMEKPEDQLLREAIEALEVLTPEEREEFWQSMWSDPAMRPALIRALTPEQKRELLAHLKQQLNA